MVLEEGLFDSKKETLYFSKKATHAAEKIDPNSNFNNFKISKECFEALKNIIDAR